MNSVFNCLKLLQELLSPTLCISTSSFLPLFGAIRISTSIFTRSSGIISLLPSIICSIHFAFQPALQCFHQLQVCNLLLFSCFSVFCFSFPLQSFLCFCKIIIGHPKLLKYSLVCRLGRVSCLQCYFYGILVQSHVVRLPWFPQP